MWLKIKELGTSASLSLFHLPKGDLVHMFDPQPPYHFVAFPQPTERSRFSTPDAGVGGEPQGGHHPGDAARQRPARRVAAGRALGACLKGTPKGEPRPPPVDPSFRGF